MQAKAQAKNYDTARSTDKISHVKPNFKDQHFSHRQECDGGVKFIEMLQHADSLQFGCVPASEQVYDESVDVPEVLVTS
jgi:hypothetical protein